MNERSKERFGEEIILRDTQYKESTFIAFGACTVALNIALTAFLVMIPLIRAYSVIILCLTMIPAMDLFGWKRALIIWAATALLMFFIGHYGDQLMMYLLLGWYPVIEPWVGKQEALLRNILKIVLGIILGGILCITTKYVMGSMEEIAGFSSAMLIILLFVILIFMIDLMVKTNRGLYEAKYKKYIVRILEAGRIKKR